MVDFSEFDKMKKISGKVDKSNTYNIPTHDLNSGPRVLTNVI